MAARRSRFLILAAGFALIASTAATQSLATCRQALVLALDASLSVDPHEARLQRDGLALALTDPTVADALIGVPNSHVMLAVFEWSGRYDQSILVDWTKIDTLATLEDIASTLQASQPLARTGRTALGEAMLFAADLLREQAHCGTRTLDVSGDGPNNSSVPPEEVRTRLNRDGITVNGLVIEQPAPSSGGPALDLTGYYQSNVILGPTAFTETIIGFDDYRDAIKRKLLRELVPALSYAPPSRHETRAAIRRQ